MTEVDTPTRVLALDYGSARCGAAISDPTGLIATPLPAIERPGSRRGMAAIAALVAEWQPREIVVGLPLSLSGGDSDQTRETRAFAASLERRLRPGPVVHLHDERFTTRMANSLGDRRDPAGEDSRAAAHLLDSWLAAGAGAQGAVRAPTSTDAAPRGR